MGYSNFKYIFDKIKNDTKILRGLGEYFFKLADFKFLKSYITILKDQLVLILNLSFSSKLSIFEIFKGRFLKDFDLSLKSQLSNLKYLNLFRISNNIFFSEKLKILDFNFLKFGFENK